MERSFVIKLTVVLYKLTEGFPEREPLKFWIREKANAVLSNLLCLGYNNPVGLAKEQKGKLKEVVLRDIQVLRGFFAVAKEQAFTRKDYILVLSQEYQKIARNLEKELSLELARPKPEKQEKAAQSHFSESFLPQPSIKKQHQEILDLLSQKGTLQVKDLEQFFPQLATRTIRRYCEFLLSHKLVKRVGRDNKTGYALR